MGATRPDNGHGTETEIPTARRPWHAPALQRHAALTVLTQSVIGPGVPFLLQIGLSGVGGNRVGPGGVIAPATAPAGAPGGAPYHGPYTQ